MSRKFDFDKLIEAMQKAKTDLPRLLANQAQNHFADSFKAGGWDGRPWKEVKRRQEGTPEYKYPKKKGLSRRTKPILVKSGTLRRAVSMSARVVTWDKIQLVVDLPYAERHNEGKDGMPKRQFMGDSQALKDKQIKLINEYMEKVWKS
jgi:phage gpG-like protein